jgi:threonine synthase
MIKGVLERYKKFLPINDSTPIFTLGEGDTPLIKSRNIAKTIGCDNLYFKLEGSNPTGSFKDRGMIVAVVKAMENGVTNIVCASTGNTSASAAAYGAYLGLQTSVIVPKGKVASGKLAQAVAYGARIIMIDGNFDKALKIAIQLSENNPIELVNSVNPYRIEGQKTAAFEIIDDMGTSPDMLFIPVGNAGNITAYWKGFLEYKNKNKSDKLPEIHGYQAERSAPIVNNKIIENPETLASAIRIGNPASWKEAINARDESNGLIDSVNDDEIYNAYKMLASTEGIFCEPASAASLAGLLKEIKNDVNYESKIIVCVLTGNGLKDPDIASRIQPTFYGEYTDDYDSIEKALLM